MGDDGHPFFVSDHFVHADAPDRPEPMDRAFLTIYHRADAAVGASCNQPEHSRDDHHHHRL